MIGLCFLTQKSCYPGGNVQVSSTDSGTSIFHHVLLKISTACFFKVHKHSTVTTTGSQDIYTKNVGVRNLQYTSWVDQLRLLDKRSFISTFLNNAVEVEDKSKTLEMVVRGYSSLSSRSFLCIFSLSQHILFALWLKVKYHSSLQGKILSSVVCAFTLPKVKNCSNFLGPNGLWKLAWQ